ncbi:hypothetical protein PAPHI01_2720, partial [Pancytospora philotis]
IVFSDTPTAHALHLETVFSKLKAAGLTLNRAKCKLGMPEIKILGNIVTAGFIKPDPEKQVAITNFKKPEAVHELRSFLGLTNYCREFIPQYAVIAKPLFMLLQGQTMRSKKSLQWDDRALAAFKNLKEKIGNATKRAQPDFKNPFILITDASDEAIGAILAQKTNSGKEQMISAYSKALDATQKRYSVTDKELLAVVKAVDHYRHYLLGKQFTLKTDHKALAYLWEASNPTSRLLRWAMKLQEYNFQPEYIKGELNAADGLSRYTTVSSIVIDDAKITVSDKETQRKILQQYHSYTGHGSANTMKYLLNAKYHWTTMFHDIDELVNTCEICSKAGYERRNTKHRIITTTHENELWECDLIGILPRTRTGKKFIFVAIDHYSKWLETKAIAAKTKEAAVQAITELIINKHGTPEKILTDCGLEFKNDYAKAFAERAGIRWIYASPSHHGTVGAVERANQTLFSKLRKLNNFSPKSWDSKLSAATAAVNASYNRSIGTCPFMIVKCMRPQLPIDEELMAPDGKTSKTAVLARRDQHFMKYAQRNIIKGQKRINEKLRIGDKVLIFREVLGDEFKNRWENGFIIKEIIAPDAYIVVNGNRILRVNKKHIKLNLGEGGVVPSRHLPYSSITV